MKDPLILWIAEMNSRNSISVCKCGNGYTKFSLKLTDLEYTKPSNMKTREDWAKECNFTELSAATGYKFWICTPFTGVAETKCCDDCMGIILYKVLNDGRWTLGITSLQW